MDIKYATAINCMEGRTQIPVIEFMKNKFGIDYVDIITEPGPNKILAEKDDKSIIESLIKRVEISIKIHESKHIAITGHYDCAGNPVDKNEQIKHIVKAIETIKSWGFDVEIVGLWIDENWKVNELNKMGVSITNG